MKSMELFQHSTRLCLSQLMYETKELHETKCHHHYIFVWVWPPSQDASHHQDYSIFYFALLLGGPYASLPKTASPRDPWQSRVTWKKEDRMNKHMMFGKLTLKMVEFPTAI